jgi:sugar phosphate isomerase/epimerase
METQDEFLDHAFRRFGSRIVLTHLKDADVQDGKLLSMRSGTGRFRTEAFLRKLREWKPYVDVSLEQVTDADLDDTVSTVRDIIGRN